MNCNILCAGSLEWRVDKDAGFGLDPTGNGIRLRASGAISERAVNVFRGARVVRGECHYGDHRCRFEGSLSALARASEPRSGLARISTEKFKFPFDIKVQICRMRVSPTGVVSSAGRAPALQAGGQRFDPVTTHHYFRRASSRSGSSVG